MRRDGEDDSGAVIDAAGNELGDDTELLHVNDPAVSEDRRTASWSKNMK